MDEQTSGGMPHPQPPQPPPAAPGPGSHRRRGSGGRAGLWLIIVGIVVLAAQYIPGLAWWNFWPLIIVAAGAVQAFTPGEGGWGVTRLFDGLVTVAWGLVFLAITLGYASWGVFWSILRLWPVLLIALGLELLGKALGQSWIRAAGSVVIIAALAFAVVTSGGFGAGWPSADGQGGFAARQVSEPLDGARRARLDLDVAAADLTLASGSQLVSASGSGVASPALSVERTGDEARVKLTGPRENGPWIWPGASGGNLDVSLSDAVLWDIRMAAGAAAVDADLSGMQVVSFSLKPGVADCKIRLGRPGGPGPNAVSVEGGVSSVSLLVPRGVEARVVSESGLAGHTVRGDFEPQGGRVWQTPGYRQAVSAGSPVWDIDIRTGIGSVTVDTY